MTQAGHAANRVAASNTFEAFKARKAPNTNTRYTNDLAAFAQYLAEMELSPGSLSDDPQAWQGITWGLVTGFIHWMSQRGYAIGTINGSLATVKAYARLAMQAGTLEPTEYALIQTVKGYSRKEGKRLDDQRAERSQPTRQGRKKAVAVVITPDQAQALKTQPNTAQGRRDALLMCLLLDHGLRVGEVVRLAVGDFDLKAGRLTFYRPKVDKVQTHQLTADALAAARAYIAQDAPALGCVWRASASKRDGRAAAGSLTVQGATERGFTRRVRTLGEAVGVSGLSAHDCRHYWATQAARSGTPIDALMYAGGWNSYAMPLQYIEAAKIANAGVKLS